jgi:D-apionolactonase
MSAFGPSNPSLSIRLYGTDEPAASPRIISAGDLSVEFDAGNLRHIRFGSVEIIRAISFIVRDRNWGTYNPAISGLTIEAGEKEFRIEYQALASDELQAFRYKVQIAGTADGRVIFQGVGEAETDFVTNRTGFVVLHPIAGVSGRPVTIERVDGAIVSGKFPDLIEPAQPMMDLRSLTHEAAPGLKVTCRMEGDAFEMEDQRNWADASYKTYVRPLALPWPYTLRRGDKIEQSVRLTLTGAAPPVIASTGRVEMRLGPTMGPAPKLGVGLDPDNTATSAKQTDTLRLLGAKIGICHHDPRRGHNAESLKKQLDLAKTLGLTPWLEAVVASVDEYESELNALGRIVESLGRPFPLALLSPAPDLKCTLPGSVWPPAPPPEAFFRTARKALNGVQIGGGMFSLFTEMNRKRPPTELLDLVSFTTTATMHAGDDHSVMEGLESLDAIAKSARAIAGDVPYAVGPSSIGMRMNPYGESPMSNPRNIRQAMNYNDPRQRSLLGASWAIGFFAHFARGGAQYISIGDLTGAFGVLHTRQAWPQPWFDDNGGVFPIFHALRGLASLASKQMVSVGISSPTEVAAIATRDGAGAELWASNLTPTAKTIVTEIEPTEVMLISENNFVEASQNASYTDEAARKPNSQSIEMPPYAFARIRLT